MPHTMWWCLSVTTDLLALLYHFDQFRRPCYVLHVCQNFIFSTSWNDLYIQFFRHCQCQILWAFFHLPKWIHGYIDQYICYISAIFNRPWLCHSVTAELMKIWNIIRRIKTCQLTCCALACRTELSFNLQKRNDRRKWLNVRLGTWISWCWNVGMKMKYSIRLVYKGGGKMR